MDLSVIRENIASEMGLVVTDQVAINDTVDSVRTIDTSSAISTREDTLEERLSLLEQKFRGEGLISVKEARQLYSKIDALENKCSMLEKRIQQLLEEF